MLPRDLPFLAYSSRSSRICSRTWLGLGLGLGLGLVADLLADRREVLVDHHAVELRDRLLHLVRVRGRVRGRGRVRVNQVELRDRLLHLLEGHIRLQARSHRVAGSLT